MNGMESVRDLLDGATYTPPADPEYGMRWSPPTQPPPADHEEPNP